MSENSNKSTAREFNTPWWVGLYRLPKNRKEFLESAYSSNSRLNLLTKRKRLHPLSEMSSSRASDKFVTQRVLSAKAHRVKQLQNQLNDAHIHLQELSNENRMLRAMQKKQEAALARYENSSAELPSMLNSHEEEMRIQQTKFRQLKQQHKEVTQKLKEKEMQLQQLKDEHQHLLELSKDRNLMEREKLQAQVAELNAKVQQQNETISTLQRRIALEAKNFRHQLQNEINKHKDTRHDLDLAISNADKLSSIIEMKEKMLSTAASRNLKSPTKASEGRGGGTQRETYVPSKPSARINKNNSEREKITHEDRTTNSGNVGEPRDALTALSLDEGSASYRYEDRPTRVGSTRTKSRGVDITTKPESRDVLNALSQDEDTSSSRYESRAASTRPRSRASSTSSRVTMNTSRKSSKGSEDFNEVAKTIQEGMADLSLFDEDMELNDLSPEEYKNKIDSMKKDLLKKIKTEDTIVKRSTTEPPSRKHSGLRRGSTEESIEEEIEDDVELPKARSRRNSTVTFNNEPHEENAIVPYDYKHGQGDEKEHTRVGRENSMSDMKRREKYCSTILKDIENSTKIIDKHVRHFNHTKLESDKLIQQLQTVDKLNDFVNMEGDIPPEALAELNNNFKLITESTLEVPRKMAISGRRVSSRPESRTSVLGDSNMSNQELLDDLLGRK